MKFPFFKANKVGDNFVISGTKSCRLGHQFESPTNPSGVFAEWQWENERLLAKVDIFGAYSLFYYASAEEVMVSSSPLQLIAEGAPAQLDYRALGIFFRVGYFINEDTPFAKIKILPPNGRLVWQNGIWSLTGGKLLPPESTVSRQQAVEGFIELFRQSMKRYLASCPGELLLPLSGGRDSRHILFELKRLNALPSQCITVQQASLGEAEFANEVAQAVGAKHTILSQKSAIKDRILTILLTHLCSDEHDWAIALRNYCRPGNYVLLDGLGGDKLARAWKARKKNLTTEELALNIFQFNANLQGFSIEDLMSQREIQAKFPKSEAVAYLQENLKEFAETAYPLASFNFWNRGRRELSLIFASTALVPSRCVLTPYMDYELFSFLFPLPLEVTRGGTLHDEVIATAFPEYAALPYFIPNTGKKPSYSKWRTLKMTLAYLWYTVKAVRDGVSTVARIDRSLVPSEIFAELRIATSRKQGLTNTYRLYLMCLHAIRDSKSAQNLIEVILKTDYLPP